MNMIHSNILQNPTLSGRLKPTAPYAVRFLLGNLSKVNVQIPWSSMISCMDPPSRPWKFAKTRRPSASKGSNKTSPGEVKRQNCKLGQRDLVGLRCSLLELILQFLKTSKYHQMISSISEKNKSYIYIYILMYGYHRKSTTAPFLGETHTFVQQVTNHYLTPISSHHKQRQLHQQGPGSKPMLLLHQPFEGKANPGNPWMFMIDKHHPYWYQKKHINFFLGGYDFKICSFHPILSSYISYTLRRLLLDMPWNKGSVDPL